MHLSYMVQQWSSLDRRQQQAVAGMVAGVELLSHASQCLVDVRAANAGLGLAGRSV